ncbi:MAG: hypothetical protein LBI70_03635 [Rickettsiales bacterium]|jgi:DNA repair photolyase|nr:hypothetical protein [Rickettsiales bacterium]
MPREITVKTALYYHSAKFASNYDLNVYRGCEHRCVYCFAQYSHKYLESDFFKDIYVKTNLAEVLDRELTKKSWKGNMINISGVCDCYQPLESKYKLMPDILRVLLKHRNPVFILTKSPLILRDYDLLGELNSKTTVFIASTVTALDETIRKKIEPNAVASLDRIGMLHEFTKMKCRTNVMLMPIIPHLTDSKMSIEAIYHSCKINRIDNVIPSALHLRGDLKQNFYRFLELEFPDILPGVKHLYRGAYVDKKYSKILYEFIRIMKTKYGFFETEEFQKRTSDTNQVQLSLF